MPMPLVDRITAVLRQSEPILRQKSQTCLDCRHRKPGDHAAHVAERVAAPVEAERDDLKKRLEKAARTLDGMYRKALHPSDPGMSHLAGKAEGVRLALSYIAEAERVGWSAVEGKP